MKVAYVSGTAEGLPFMKFTLTYEGELRSNDDHRRKWDIRKQFHPQLKELWTQNPSLRSVMQRRHFPKNSSAFSLEVHHSLADLSKAPELRDGVEYLDLCEPITRGGKSFIPLVRDTLALNCGLKVTMLRKEEPGRIYQGGDMDNRLKTLFDALGIPAVEQVVQNDPDACDPTYCLLEDDRLITGLSVETHRLLGRENVSRHWVSLMIEVDVRVTQAKAYNQAFLGD